MLYNAAYLGVVTGPDCKGRRYVTTSDGETRVFKAGEVMFQDNTKVSPAASIPQHISGTVGDEPCNLLITQVVFMPTVDRPCPFSDG